MNKTQCDQWERCIWVTSFGTVVQASGTRKIWFLVPVSGAESLCVVCHGPMLPGQLAYWSSQVKTLLLIEPASSWCGSYRRMLAKLSLNLNLPYEGSHTTAMGLCEHCSDTYLCAWGRFRYSKNSSASEWQIVLHGWSAGLELTASTTNTRTTFSKHLKTFLFTISSRSH